MEHNHRRKYRTPKSILDRRPWRKKPWSYPDKSLDGWGQKSELADRMIASKGIGNDFNKGHRGMARSVKGAKKFVRSRFRFHEKMETKKLGHDYV